MSPLIRTHNHRVKYALSVGGGDYQQGGWIVNEFSEESVPFVLGGVDGGTVRVEVVRCDRVAERR